MLDSPSVPPPDLVRAVASELSCVDRAAIKRLIRTARKMRNKTWWRRRNQLRCSVVSSALQAAKRSLGARYAGRRREVKSWVLSARADNGSVIDAILIKVPPVAVHDDFINRPVQLEVLRFDLVDVHELRRWSARLRGRDA